MAKKMNSISAVECLLPECYFCLKVGEKIDDLCILYKDSKKLDNQPCSWYNIYMWLTIDDLEAVE